jgi:hypothetical protein
MINDPELQPVIENNTLLYPNLTTIKIKHMFDFPNNHLIKKYTDTFRDCLFILYTLLQTIPETKVFLNNTLNNFVSTNTMDKYLAEFYKTTQKFKKDIKLNRALKPTSWWETFVYLFVEKKSNGEIKIPFSDTIRYNTFLFEVAKIENKCITYENDVLNGNKKHYEKYYDYSKTIFDI